MKGQNPEVVAIGFKVLKIDGDVYTWGMETRDEF